MTSPEGKPPPFFCPHCGQKHRADLSPLRSRPGATIRTHCRRCETVFLVSLVEGRPHAEPLTESQPEGAPTAAVPAAAAPKPPPPARVPPPASKLPPPPPVKPKPEEAHALLADGSKVGRYEVRGQLDAGGTSMVYRAHDARTKRSVALKVLRADATGEVRRAFLRQIQVQANIRHPAIMPVYDRGELEDGRPFFAMELLHRPVTLEQVLARRAAGTLGETKGFDALADLEGLIDKVLLPVAEGVYVANVESGVVHGDLQPANVLLDGRTLRPYVTDFGLSRDVAEESAAAGAEPCAPSPWRAPEQVEGSCHARTDVWGLGALLQSLLVAGRTAATYAELPDDAPAGPVAILRKAMSLRTEDRYVNARQMAADLKAWRKGGWVRAVAEQGGSGQAGGDTRLATRRRLVAAGLLGAGLVVGLVVGSLLDVGGGSATTTRIQEVVRSIDLLGAEVEAARSAAPLLPPAALHGAWQALENRAVALEERLEGLEARPARKRLAFVRRRFAPPRVDVRLPAGVTLQAQVRGSDRTVLLDAGTHDLPPGHYRVSNRSVAAFAFDAVVPLVLRKAGEAPAEDAVAIWEVPVAPGAIPAGRMFVPGARVRVAQLPFAKPGVAVRVEGFVIDRAPVTCQSFQRFLISRPVAERRASAPAACFLVDREGGVRVREGMADEPVRGVSREDAEAYCAWQGEKEGRTLRLPTEAEWIVAFGARPPWTPGAEEGRAACHALGFEPLPAPARELVVGPGNDADGEETLLKGAEAEAPPEVFLGDARTIGRRDRDPTAGFRCVQEQDAE